uniref:Uncharacterized protein n=1 Tax=Chromera velia CCMP2878 TaxID=1169474 RepID=A0A0G4HVF4_9ALVE|eukprot:Cvel_8852.t1-p1 / transcript=Cvel_8852.t1 / gene=Cvel_8852 / organism=Chromera_velia_CCMP2878 / gene_product=hypothetical protein / transcript_product=hypothetical protein / location=Cvel_scaffold497:81494-82321(+) / protein_length=276 / sequence_SO=supercontig / SO=protein_coding / is_pseudo=false
MSTSLAADYHSQAPTAPQPIPPPGIPDSQSIPGISSRATATGGKEAVAAVLSHQKVLTPLSPADFNSLLNTKTFTNGSDKETVKSLYKQFVHHTAGSVQKISFAGCSRFSDDDAASLCGLFTYLLNVQAMGGGVNEGGEGKSRRSVEILDLSGTSLTDKGAVMLIETLTQVESLRGLNFDQTKVSVGTLKALRKAFEGGGMVSLGMVEMTSCHTLSREVRDRDAEEIVSIARTAHERQQVVSFVFLASFEGMSESCRKGLEDKIKGRNFKGVELWI